MATSSRLSPKENKDAEKSTFLKNLEMEQMLNELKESVKGVIDAEQKNMLILDFEIAQATTGAQKIDQEIKALISAAAAKEQTAAAKEEKSSAKSIEARKTLLKIIAYLFFHRWANRASTLDLIQNIKKLMGSEYFQSVSMTALGEGAITIPEQFLETLAQKTRVFEYDRSTGFGRMDLRYVHCLTMQFLLGAADPEMREYKISSDDFLHYKNVMRGMFSSGDVTNYKEVMRALATGRVEAKETATDRVFSWDFEEFLLNHPNVSNWIPICHMAAGYKNWKFILEAVFSPPQLYLDRAQDRLRRDQLDKKLKVDKKKKWYEVLQKLINVDSEYVYSATEHLTQDKQMIEAIQSLREELSIPLEIGNEEIRLILNGRAIKDRDQTNVAIFFNKFNERLELTKQGIVIPPRERLGKYFVAQKKAQQNLEDLQKNAEANKLKSSRERFMEIDTNSDRVKLSYEQNYFIDVEEGTFCVTVDFFKSIGVLDSQRDFYSEPLTEEEKEKCINKMREILCSETALNSLSDTSEAAIKERREQILRRMNYPITFTPPDLFKMERFRAWHTEDGFEPFKPGMTAAEVNKVKAEILPTYSLIFACAELEANQQMKINSLKNLFEVAALPGLSKETAEKLLERVFFSYIDCSRGVRFSAAQYELEKKYVDESITVYLQGFANSLTPRKKHYFFELLNVVQNRLQLVANSLESKDSSSYKNATARMISILKTVTSGEKEVIAVTKDIRNQIENAAHDFVIATAKTANNIQTYIETVREDQPGETVLTDSLEEIEQNVEIIHKTITEVMGEFKKTGTISKAHLKKVEQLVGLIPQESDNLNLSIAHAHLIKLLHLMNSLNNPYVEMLPLLELVPVPDEKKAEEKEVKTAEAKDSFVQANVLGKKLTQEEREAQQLRELSEDRGRGRLVKFRPPFRDGAYYSIVVDLTHPSFVALMAAFPFLSHETIGDFLNNALNHGSNTQGIGIFHPQSEKSTISWRVEGNKCVGRIHRKDEEDSLEVKQTKERRWKDFEAAIKNGIYHFIKEQTEDNAIEIDFLKERREKAALEVKEQKERIVFLSFPSDKKMDNDTYKNIIRCALDIPSILEDFMEYQNLQEKLDIVQHSQKIDEKQIKKYKDELKALNDLSLSSNGRKLIPLYEKFKAHYEEDQVKNLKSIAKYNQEIEIILARMKDTVFAKEPFCNFTKEEKDKYKNWMKELNLELDLSVLLQLIQTENSIRRETMEERNRKIELLSSVSSSLREGVDKYLEDRRAAYIDSSIKKLSRIRRKLDMSTSTTVSSAVSLEEKYKELDINKELKTMTPVECFLYDVLRSERKDASAIKCLTLSQLLVPAAEKNDMTVAEFENRLLMSPETVIALTINEIRENRTILRLAAKSAPEIKDFDPSESEDKHINAVLSDIQAYILKKNEKYYLELVSTEERKTAERENSSAEDINFNVTLNQEEYKRKRKLSNDYVGLRLGLHPFEKDIRVILNQLEISEGHPKLNKLPLLIKLAARTPASAERINILIKEFGRTLLIDLGIEASIVKQVMSYLLKRYDLAWRPVVDKLTYAHIGAERVSCWAPLATSLVPAADAAVSSSSSSSESKSKEVSVKSLPLIDECLALRKIIKNGPSGILARYDYTAAREKHLGILNLLKKIILGGDFVTEKEIKDLKDYAEQAVTPGGMYSFPVSLPYQPALYRIINSLVQLRQSHMQDINEKINSYKHTVIRNKGFVFLNFVVAEEAQKVLTALGKVSITPTVGGRKNSIIRLTESEYNKIITYTSKPVAAATSSLSATNFASGSVHLSSSFTSLWSSPDEPPKPIGGKLWGWQRRLGGKA